MAARDGLLFARELGLESIIVEGDSQRLVQWVQRRKKDDQGVGVIVVDILHLLDGFSGAEFYFVRRSGNGVVHSIAQKAVRACGNGREGRAWWFKILVVLGEFRLCSALDGLV
ncbi:hypothetical protein RHMOL_Rhmol10G0221500 [Rhododendron molle]|uniref:Uncharacterized protein n=1 Tax=Rhododendron molle TaxID=49168 RepID=A0ACC0M532_RHOML|nr:hypothetical protein RHMOL_Rhmol10G0221500 [Rhododendron molle]